MLLLKTDPEQMQGVFLNEKHATNVLPKRVRKGDLLLIQQDGTPTSPPLVKYVMEFEAFYSDLNHESDKIWGKHWLYIIKGKNIRAVEPFNISQVQVTSNNYGKGAILYAYIDPEDEAELVKLKLLDPI